MAACCCTCSGSFYCLARRSCFVLCSADGRSAAERPETRLDTGWMWWAKGGEAGVNELSGRIHGVQNRLSRWFRQLPHAGRSSRPSHHSHLTPGRLSDLFLVAAKRLPTEKVVGPPDQVFALCSLTTQPCSGESCFCALACWQQHASWQVSGGWGGAGPDPRSGLWVGCPPAYCSRATAAESDTLCCASYTVGRCVCCKG